MPSPCDVAEPANEPTTDTTPPQPKPPRRAGSRSLLLRCLLHPYLPLALAALLGTVSELALKRGAVDAAARHAVGLFGVEALSSAWTWCGIVTYVLSFLCWLRALRFLPLSIAYPLVHVTLVLVPLSAWLTLGEHVAPRAWVGVALVLIGITLVAKPAARAEEQL